MTHVWYLGLNMFSLLSNLFTRRCAKVLYKGGKEEHNLSVTISLAKWMTKKIYTYGFSAAMTRPEISRYLDFQTNIWLVVAWW